jgi:hypothetical protein
VILRDKGLATPTSTKLGERITGFRTDPVFALVTKLVDAHDYRELAVAGLTTVLDRSRLLDAAEREFIVDFAAYVLDSGQDGEQRTLAREALRSAVKQVLLTKSTGGIPTESARAPLVHRSWCDHDACALITYPKWSFWPAVAVRWEFGGTWIDRSGAGYRRTISADALTVAIPFSDHVGLQASVLDLVGPFSELALRDTGATYVNRIDPMIEFLRPRVQIWLALPEITRRVELFAGVSASALHRDREGSQVTYAVHPFDPDFSVDVGTELILW